MEYKTVHIYDRIYDDQSKQKDAKLLGIFQVIEEIEEDGYSELFVGRNVDTGDVCLIRGREVCYIDSGIIYTIFPLKHLYVRDSFYEGEVQ